MSFSQSSASHFVPLLARVVLAAAFIPAGYAKITEKQTFSGDQAQILIDLEVVEKPGPAIVQQAAYQQPGSIRSAPSTRIAQAAEEQPVPTGDAPAESGKAPNGQSQAASGDSPLKVEARALHNITIMLHNHNWPDAWFPNWMAWAAAVTELIGGGMILIGLASRICALGLACVMGFAFWMTSLATVKAQFPMIQHTDAFAQAALFVLAFGIFLTGAGAVSLDRLFFHSRQPQPMIEDD